MTDNKKQTSLSILGIDTASPDHEVKDGKCSELHNLRYSAGAWRNVHPFVKKHNLPQDNKYQIIYHHPADADNRYIATGEDEWTETYYAWCTDVGIPRCYSIVEPENIKVGDALYDCPDMEFAPNVFEKIAVVETVQKSDDGGVICSFSEIVSDGKYLYAWTNKYGTTYYTETEIPQVGDTVYSITADNFRHNIGRVLSLTIDSENSDVYTIITSIRAQPGGDSFNQNKDKNSTIIYFETKLTSLNYNEQHNRSITHNGEYFLVVSINEGVVSINQRLQECNTANEYTISHFGKILIITDKQTCRNSYFRIIENRYVKVNSNSISGSCNIATNPHGVVDDVSIKLEHIVSGGTVSSQPGNDSYKLIYNEPFSDDTFPTSGVDSDNQKWCRGIFAYFIEIRSNDGEPLYTSPVKIYNGVSGNNSEIESGMYLAAKELSASIRISKELYDELTSRNNKIWGARYAPQIFVKQRPYISISCNWNNDDMVFDVAVYSTRLYSPIEFDANLPKWKDLTSIIKEPFYLLMSIQKERFTRLGDSYRYSGEIQIADLITNEHSTTYTPIQKADSFYWGKSFEYNNRLHLISPYQFAPNIDKTAVNFADTQTSVKSVVLKYTSDNNDYYQRYPATLFGQAQYSNTQPAFISIIGNVDTIYFCTEDLHIIDAFKMQYIPALNMSIHIHTSNTDTEQYVHLLTDIQLSETGNEQINAHFTDKVQSANRIQVSENNNCFVFPFANSYRIGTQNNRIIAVNSAAIEMSDSKFGEFPLYVFTEEGIFAMQSGSETLYSAIVPIAYDKAISPQTLAINYNVLFISARGLMALSSGGLVCLSAELNTKDNLIPEFLRTAQLVRLPKYNEVMAVNENNSTAYIFSLDNKVWSTRDISIGRILNNNEMVVANNEIIDITSESDAPQTMSFLIDTRQVKLGAMELKRVETVIVRFESATAQTINVEIYGSINLTSWIPIRTAQVTTNKDIIIRRAPMSAKYLRFRVFGAVTDDIKIMTLDLEYYFRMIHRMR